MENPHNLFGNIPKPHGNFETKLIIVLIAFRIFVNNLFTLIFFFDRFNGKV